MKPLWCSENLLDSNILHVSILLGLRYLKLYHPQIPIKTHQTQKINQPSINLLSLKIFMMPPSKIHLPTFSLPQSKNHSKLYVIKVFILFDTFLIKMEMKKISYNHIYPIFMTLISSHWKLVSLVLCPPMEWLKKGCICRCHKRWNN